MLRAAERGVVRYIPSLGVRSSHGDRRALDRRHAPLLNGRLSDVNYCCPCSTRMSTAIIGNTQAYFFFLPPLPFFPPFAFGIEGARKIFNTGGSHGDSNSKLMRSSCRTPRSHKHA